ncbi:hypothetical protein AVEN_71031-1 [Araneus ventricosus]|uniref:Uncharacterized protein n=1 Tax=Araneus ventricosus TaxID=182803 RepID=A0A4Y2N3W4_ARAVE|nr:hypothetical protein AVEN_71031-1 [Araneus ventricosus]
MVRRVDMTVGISENKKTNQEEREGRKVGNLCTKGMRSADFMSTDTNRNLDPLGQREELDIHGESAPIHLERFAPHCSNFQPIHFGGTFTLAPNCRLLRTPPFPPPDFKTGKSLRLTPTPPPQGRFSLPFISREHHSPSPGSYFSYMIECGQ